MLAANLDSIYIWQIPSLDITFSTNVVPIQGHGKPTVSTNRVVVLSWDTNAPSFVVEEISDLATTNWLTMTNEPTITNGELQVTLPFTNSSRFYRLKNP